MLNVCIWAYTTTMCGFTLYFILPPMKFVYVTKRSASPSKKKKKVKRNKNQFNYEHRFFYLCDIWCYGWIFLFDSWAFLIVPCVWQRHTVKSLVHWWVKWQLKLCMCLGSLYRVVVVSNKTYMKDMNL